MIVKCSNFSITLLAYCVLSILNAELALYRNLVINISAQQKTQSRAIKNNKVLSDIILYDSTSCFLLRTDIYYKITFSAGGISCKCSKEPCIDFKM